MGARERGEGERTGVERVRARSRRPAAPRPPSPPREAGRPHGSAPGAGGGSTIAPGAPGRAAARGRQRPQRAAGRPAIGGRAAPSSLLRPRRAGRLAIIQAPRLALGRGRDLNRRSRVLTAPDRPSDAVAAWGVSLPPPPSPRARVDSPAALSLTTAPLSPTLTWQATSRTPAGGRPGRPACSSQTRAAWWWTEGVPFDELGGRKEGAWKKRLCAEEGANAARCSLLSTTGVLSSPSPHHNMVCPARPRTSPAPSNPNALSKTKDS